MNPERTRISKGYKYVYAPESLNSGTYGSYKGWVLEHRYVMEQELGRPLSDDEEVHHIDLNKLNNNPGNLIVLSGAQHSLLHHELKNHDINPAEVNTLERIIKLLPSYEFRKCIDCGNELSVLSTSKRKTNRCQKCSNIHARKVIRPSKEQLEEEVKHFPYLDLEKKYGVSTAAIKKWMRAYGIQIPNRHKHWITNKPYVMTERRILANRKKGEKLKGRWLTQKCPYAKPIIQYSLQGNKLEEFSSATDAARKYPHLRISPILRCCKGFIKSYKNFIWRYKSSISQSRVGTEVDCA